MQAINDLGMDALYFNTKNKEALLKELGLIVEQETEDGDPFSVNLLRGGIYEHPGGWAIVWLGRLPAHTETQVDDEGLEREVVTEWQEGEFFNIYLRGQENMDYFTQRLVNATLLTEPATPNMKIL